ncbi:MAG: DUF1588 domain-containing protein [Rhodospirillaceae bacterium]
MVRLCAGGVAVVVLAALGLGGCSRSASHPHAAAARSEPAPDGSAKRLRILTEAQYLNTIAYVFGPDIRPVATFPPSQRIDGLLAVGTSRGGVTTQQLELYQKAAATVAGMAVDRQHRGFLINCKPASETAADKACATVFLREKGRLLNRRPLSTEELDAFVAQAGKAADKLQDFYAGLGVALEGMLVGPDVLFVTETAEPDPQNPGHERLDAFSLATRLSLFLWNAAPDDTVLKAAETGEIQTAKGRARIVNLMLASRRLETGMRAFFDDMFGFDDFNVLAKDPTVYPKFNGQMMADAREETLRTVVDHLIVHNGDYRDLFTTHDTFISPAVAVLYGLRAPPNWSPYTFPADVPRAGVLTQVSFLAVHSHPGRSSPTLRGKAVREILLCQPVPPPPPNVDFSAVEDPKSPFKTVRERINFHQKNPACAGCHKIMDPMGLALENFDAVGRYRDNEKGAPIDASGSLDGKSFKDVAGLGQVLHDHPALTSCLVKRAYSYGSGGPSTADDKDKLDYFNARFAEQGYKLPGLLRTIALSNAFSKIADHQNAAAAAASVK